MLIPKLFTTLRGYTRADFQGDLGAGLVRFLSRADVELSDADQALRVFDQGLARVGQPAAPAWAASRAASTSVG